MLSSAAAAAQTREPEAPALRLTWRAPSDCGQGAEIVARTQQLLGSWRPAEPLVAEGSVEGTPGQHLTLELAIGTGSERRVRRVEATTCEEINRVSSVVLALAIHPELASAPAVAGFESDVSVAGTTEGAQAPPTANEAPGRTGQPTRGSASSPRARSSTNQARAPRTAVAPASAKEPGRARHPGPARTQMVVGAGPAAMVGVFGGVAFGVMASAALNVGPLALGVHGNYVPSHDITTDSPAWARFAVLGAGIGVCWLLPAALQVRVGPCLGLDLGKIRGEGKGIDQGRTAARDWSAIAPGLRLTWDAWRLVRLETGLDAVFSLQRPEFYLDDRVVMRPAAVGLYAFAAATMHFP
jgi:hypothetical protein